MRRKAKKQFIYSGLLALIIACLFSCSDDKTYDFPGDPGKIYVRIQTEHMVNSTRNLVNVNLARTPIGSFGKAEVKFPVHTTMPAGSRIEVTLEIDDSLVKTYNAENGTEYIAVNSSWVSVTNNTLIIEQGEYASSDSIVVKIDEDKQMEMELGQYMIPIKIREVKGNMVVSENSNTIFMLVSVKEDPYAIPLADRTGWTIADCSSEEKYGESGGNGFASCVLDGNYYSFWHSEWYFNSAVPPHYLTIDMGKEAEMVGFQYVTRNNYAGFPKTIVVDTSLNGMDWMPAGTYYNLPTGANVEYRSFFEEFRQARFFRITITEVYNATYTALAEVNAFVVDK